MDRIPITILNLLHIVKLLFHQKARIESWLGSVREVNAWDSVVVVELDILFENVIALLLKSKQVWRREESSVACRIELVGPRGSVRVTISVVLVLKVFTPSLFILSDLYITFVSELFLPRGWSTDSKICCFNSSSSISCPTPASVLVIWEGGRRLMRLNTELAIFCYYSSILFLQQKIS